MRKFFNLIGYAVAGFAGMIALFVMFFSMMLACIHILPALNVILGYNILYGTMVCGLAGTAAVCALGIMSYRNKVKRKAEIARILAKKLIK